MANPIEKALALFWIDTIGVGWLIELFSASSEGPDVDENPEKQRYGAPSNACEQLSSSLVGNLLAHGT